MHSLRVGAQEQLHAVPGVVAAHQQPEELGRVLALPRGRGQRRRGQRRGQRRGVPRRRQRRGVPRRSQRRVLGARLHRQLLPQSVVRDVVTLLAATKTGGKKVNV